MASIAEKMQIKSGQALSVINVPKDYSQTLKKQIPEVKYSSKVTLEDEAVLIFINSMAEAESIALKNFLSADEDCLFWIAYPKGSSKVKTDVNRDILWKATESTGWRPVRMVALDETWSGMRFRPADKVKSTIK